MEILRDGTASDSCNTLLPSSDETILLNLTALVVSPVQPWGGGHALALARDPSASSNLLPIQSPSFLAPPLVGDGGPGWVRPLKRQFKAGRGSSDLLALSTIVTYGEWRVINWSSRSEPSRAFQTLSNRVF